MSTASIGCNWEIGRVGWRRKEVSHEKQGWLVLGRQIYRARRFVSSNSSNALGLREGYSKLYLEGLISQEAGTAVTPSSSSSAKKPLRDACCVSKVQPLTRCITVPHSTLQLRSLMEPTPEFEHLQKHVERILDTVRTQIQHILHANRYKPWPRSLTILTKERGPNC